MSLTNSTAKAIDLYRSHQYTAAYKVFASVFTIEPLPAVLYMAKILFLGQSKEEGRNPRKAISLLEPYKSLNGHAAFILFDLYYAEGECDKALECLNDSAKLKFTPAFYRLGQANYFGYCMEKSFEKSLYYYKKGADEGHVWSKVYYSKYLMLGFSGLKSIPVGIFGIIAALLYAISEMTRDMYSDKFIE